MALWRIVFRSERRLDPLAPFIETHDHRFLARPCSHELHGMHPAALAKTIDAADPLLETQRRPWQLEVHDEPATVMEIEAFAGGVGRQKNRRFARRETAQHISALARAETTVELQRPEIPELVPYYGEAAAEVLSVKPGITSLAKLVGRDNTNFQETLELDLRYLRQRSLLYDFRILVGTVILVLTGRNIGH